MTAPTKTTGKSSTAVATGATGARGAAARWQDLSEQERDRLISQAQHGDQQALQRVLAGTAVDAPLRERLMDLPAHAREYLITVVFGKDNHLEKSMLTAKAKLLERDLKGDGRPSALEQMLIERVVTCWLAAYLADIEVERHLQAGASLTKAAFYEHRQDRAQARYLSAMTALARVRRLLAPVVAQVNIAQPGAHQLNVAMPPAGAEAVLPVLPAGTAR